MTIDLGARAIRRMALVACGAAVASLYIASAAYAQNYPTKPVRLIVPLAAGGGTDVLARPVAQRLSEIWGQPVIVENKPGANQIIGTEYAARSAPDGYTILIAGEAGVTFNRYMYSKLPYDTLKDFVGITRLMQVHAFVVAPTTLPASTAKEFVALMKKDGAKMNYGSPGIGDPMHIGMEWFKTVAGFPLEHIPYKGAAAAQLGILGGDTHAQVTTGLTADQHIKAGKLKVIVTSGPARQPAYPDVPTLAEAGFPDLTLGYYLALMAPVGTPMDIVRKISTDFHKVMREPAFRSRFIDPYGIELINDTPEEFAEFLKRDMVAAEGKVKASGAKLD